MNKTRERCGIDCLGPAEEFIKKKKDEIAAVIIEPLVMAAGGMIIYPKEYLRGIADIARKYDIHLIADEVATGFGRTGRMFACEHANVRPDIMCLSKGITAGYLPMGATLVTDDIFRAFYADHSERKTFYHGHTYTANPLASSAALASLGVFREEKTLERVKGPIRMLGEGLERFRALDIVGDVRHIGMIGAIELVKNKATKEPFDPDERIGLEIYRRGLERHLLLRPLGNITYLFLPLSIRREELVYILEEMFHIVRKVGATYDKISCERRGDRERG
jgi:adenosylmethionine-8-amino-7-oxononanoate aminotransferase